ncbi:MAG TPA: NADH-quinone oxidoreductase subunit J [Thermoanaerobaculia bacterium]|nr:NADH-quinone oxidoreductase subunit J [Thermoanaerobaculia bacterium]
MTTTRLVFDAAGMVALLFAAVMVLHRHPAKSVLALVVSFFALAACYVLVSAPFIAAIQVIVYAGAILVLFLFVIMLLNIQQEEHRGDPHPIQHVLSGAALLLFGALLFALLRSHGGAGLVAEASATPDPEDIAPIARMLFSDYLLPFEALSVLLLAALVGSFVLARREKTS